jgi:hypothetical protein
VATNIAKWLMETTTRRNRKTLLRNQHSRAGAGDPRIALRQASAHIPPPNPTGRTSMKTIVSSFNTIRLQQDMTVHAFQIFQRGKARAGTP